MVHSTGSKTPCYAYILPTFIFKTTHMSLNMAYMDDTGFGFGYDLHAVFDMQNSFNLA